MATNEHKQEVQAVEMTAEEYAAYQAFKAEKAKKDAEARIEALRGSYADMSESFINKTPFGCINETNSSNAALYSFSVP